MMYLAVALRFVSDATATSMIEACSVPRCWFYSEINKMKPTSFVEFIINLHLTGILF
jgi:hypothetical protein